MWRTLGVVALLALSGCAASGEAAGGRTTCDDLADEAIQASEDQGVRLLKVRDPRVEVDKQESGWGKPTGGGEVVVLRCLGQGVWSDASEANVRLELRVDADGDAFVFYQPTL